MCVRTVGTAPNRQFVVEWLDVSAYMHDMAHLTFEAVLSETTNTVDVLFNTLTGTGMDSIAVDGSNATVGIQNAAGTLFVAHSGTVSTTAGIRFAPR